MLSCTTRCMCSASHRMSRRRSSTRATGTAQRGRGCGRSTPTTMPGSACASTERRPVSAAKRQFPDVPDKRSLMNGPVTYAARGQDPRMPTLRQPGAERDLRAFIESMVEREPEIFFTKDWDWNSESEYRFLLRGETREEESIDIQDALEAVIAGPRLHPVDRSGLWTLCQEIEIEALQIQWQMGAPVGVKMLDPTKRPLRQRSMQRSSPATGIPAGACCPHFVRSGRRALPRAPIFTRSRKLRRHGWQRSARRDRHGWSWDHSVRIAVVKIRIQQTWTRGGAPIAGVTFRRERSHANTRGAVGASSDGATIASNTSPGPANQRSTRELGRPPVNRGRCPFPYPWAATWWRALRLCVRAGKSAGRRGRRSRRITHP
jgi:hypothetical protein